VSQADVQLQGQQALGWELWTAASLAGLGEQPFRAAQQQ